MSNWENMMVRMCEEDYNKTERRRKLKKFRYWAVIGITVVSLVAVGFIAGMIAFGG